VGFQTEPLEEEIEKLKQHLKEMMETNLSLIEENKQKVLQLKEAESVIKFYGDENKWRKQRDSECDWGSIDHIGDGGKRARQYLTKYKTNE
jgi:regulator of replication initiation timing